MRTTRRSARAAAVLGVLLAAGLAGCAGPKRFPPVTGEVPPPVSPAERIPSLVGVGLVEKEQALTISTNGACLLIDADSGRQLERLGPAGGDVSCTRSGADVVWSAAGRGGRCRALMLQPVDPARRVRWADAEYRGGFLVLPSPGSVGLTLVNNVELEDYLRGVVPWEIGRHGRDRLAALAAQAVAARTYAISHLGSRVSRGFDVYASVMDQVYRGSSDEDALCNEAIDVTRGLVLRSKGREIDAYYSACCGGVTSTIQEVWAQDARPYLVSHPDSRGGDCFCEDYRYYHWREEWSAVRLEEILRETLPEYMAYMSEAGRAQWAGRIFRPGRKGDTGAVPGRLLDLDILVHTTSGRVAELAVRTEAGEYRVRGDRVRWVLRPASGNPAILRSALFELELVRDGDRLQSVAARGRGYGHGIGLCQAGSLEMARRGHSYREILAHYYPGADLIRVTGGR